MPYHVVEPPRPARTAGIVALVALMLVMIAAGVASASVSRPLKVTVDGVERTLTAGSTVSDLLAEGAFHARSGDLLAVDGSVLRPLQGDPPRVVRNGSAASQWQRLYRGDVIVSRQGTDRRESLEVTNVPIPYDTVIRGKGPLAVVQTPGAEGMRRVTRGEISGIELSSITLAAPQVEVLVRRNVKPGSKLVALTFDDGPWKGSTEKILRTLRENDVRATFFMPGYQVKRYPKIAKAVAAQGHLVGSHSYSHRRFDSLSKKKVKSEVKRGRAAILKATGVDSRWIRPPYGAMDKTAWKGVKSAKGWVVMWDVDSRDWKKPGAKRLAKNVVKKTKPGSVILFHDGGGDRRQTVAALPVIIRDLRAKGYIFVTVEEMAVAKKVTKRPAAKTASKMYADR